MAGAEGWTDVGAARELAATPLQRIAVGNSEIALSFRDGSFGAVANACNHAGGPLGEGCLDSDYIICPWHHWKFHRVSGVGEPGFAEDRVPSFPVKVEHGRVLVNLRAAARGTKKPHPPHPLAPPVTHHVLIAQRLHRNTQQCGCAGGRETVEHPFGTIKARMGATHFRMKTLPRVASEMALHVLAYNLTRVMNIMGIQPLMAAIRA
jgi:nitrite reductase/ring-hydroxylating ferredoxin subunit